MDQTAIVHNVKTSHRATAIVRVGTYDVWGNDSDGWEVNNTFLGPKKKVPVQLVIHNVPRFPGAKDEYRSFPNSGSFSANLACSFDIAESTIRDLLNIGPRVKINIDGDGTYITVDLAKNGFPIGEIYVEGYTDV